MNGIDPSKLFEGFCPFCGSHMCRVAKTVKPVRKNYCSACNAEWKSLTVNLVTSDALKTVAEIMDQKEELERKYPFL